MDYITLSTRTFNSIFEQSHEVQRDLDILYRIFSGVTPLKDEASNLKEVIKKASVYANALISTKALIEKQKVDSLSSTKFWSNLSLYLASLRGVIMLIDKTEITSGLSLELAFILPILKTFSFTTKAQDLLTETYFLANLNKNILSLVETHEQKTSHWMSAAQKISHYASSLGTAAFLGNVITDSIGLSYAAFGLGIFSASCGAISVFSSFVGQYNKRDTVLESKIKNFEICQEEFIFKLKDKIKSESTQNLVREYFEASLDELRSCKDYNQLWSITLSFFMVAKMFEKKFAFSLETEMLDEMFQDSYSLMVKENEEIENQKESLKILNSYLEDSKHALDTVFESLEAQQTLSFDRMERLSNDLLRENIHEVRGMIDEDQKKIEILFQPQKLTDNREWLLNAQSLTNSAHQEYLLKRIQQVQPELTELIRF